MLFLFSYSVFIYKYPAFFTESRYWHLTNAGCQSFIEPSLFALLYKPNTPQMGGIFEFYGKYIGNFLFGNFFLDD